MGKKRKVPNGSAEKSNGLTLNSWEDVADEQDEFLLNREKILLGDDVSTKRRKRNDDEYNKLDTDQVEVLGLHDSEDESDPVDDFDDGESDSEEEIQHLSKAAAAARAHAAKIHVSDEEEDDGDHENWGDIKNNYYGADDVETEQAALDEEAEAKRIQSKNLEALTDADYGLDDEEWILDDTKEESTGARLALTETLSDLVIPENATAKDLTKIMKDRYPEFSALSNELVDLQAEHERLRLLCAESSNPRVICKYWTLGTYLASLAMYLAILTETSTHKKSTSKLAKPPSELRHHLVMKTILSFKASWEEIKDVEELEELDDEDTDAPSYTHLCLSPSPDLETKPKKPNSKPSKAIAKTSQREARAAALEAHLAEFTDSLQIPTSSTLKLRTKKAPTVAFGDETELTAHEAAEKASRRRNLRFYTSQIAQKTQKRGAASRDNGGDADLPYRERWRDKQLRLAAEAEAQKEQAIQQQQSQQKSQHKRPKETKPASDDDYEDLVSRMKTAKGKNKADRRDEFESSARAEREFDPEAVGPDGKRHITYQIEKNRGLTSSKRKQVRNPRVKKRLQFEQKKKKLGSMRAVYKGGPGPSGYQGELTGIKTNLVKSVKL